MPVLLEDLYPPPARAVYRGVRAWEQNVLSALDGLPAMPTSLEDAVRRLARTYRRHLLLVQRLRHAIVSADGTPEDHPRYDLWVRHRVGWSGDLAHGLETLALASRPFLDREGLDAEAVETLTSVAETLCIDVRERNDELVSGLEAPQSGRTKRS